MLKYLNPYNYLRFMKNRLIEYRIRYGAPMRVVSKALGENIAFIVSSEKSISCVQSCHIFQKKQQ